MVFPSLAITTRFPVLRTRSFKASLHAIRILIIAFPLPSVQLVNAPFGRCPPRFRVAPLILSSAAILDLYKRLHELRVIHVDLAPRHIVRRLLPPLSLTEVPHDRLEPATSLSTDDEYALGLIDFDQAKENASAAECKSEMNDIQVYLGLATLGAGLGDSTASPVQMRSLGGV